MTAAIRRSTLGSPPERPPEAAKKRPDVPRVLSQVAPPHPGGGSDRDRGPPLPRNDPDRHVIYESPERHAGLGLDEAGGGGGVSPRPGGGGAGEGECGPGDR